MTIDRAAVRQLIDHMAAIAQEGDDWPPPGHRIPASVIPPESVARRWLYLTKLNWLGGANAIPSDIGVIAGMGPATPGLASVIRGITSGAPISFVGDLDPLDVTTFLSLKAEGVDAHYLGVGDGWLQICQEARPTLPTIPLSGFEIENLRGLGGFELPTILGPESAALLVAGQKLELEGSFNEFIYGQPHVKRIREFVFGQ